MNAQANSDRYRKQALLPHIGPEGQRRIEQARLLLVGCGALGCVIADQLVRAGVGSIRLVDRDFVELANLHRQPLFTESDASQSLPKAIAAQRRLAAANSLVRIEPIVADFNSTIARDLAADVDVIIDGTDNFETRYLLNDLAVYAGLPYVYGGVVGHSGTQMTILPRSPEGNRPWEPAGRATACLACLWPTAPAPGTTLTCDTAGVLGPAASVVASMQSIETIKVLLGAWDQIEPSLRDIVAWSGQVRKIDTRSMLDANCPCCGQRRFDHLDGSAGSSTVSLCGRHAVQVQPATGRAVVDMEAIAARLDQSFKVQRNAYTLRCEIAYGGSVLELTLFTDGRAIIKGTDQPAIARAVYSRYIGT